MGKGKGGKKKGKGGTERDGLRKLVGEISEAACAAPDLQPFQLVQLIGSIWAMAKEASQIRQLRAEVERLEGLAVKAAVEEMGQKVRELQDSTKLDPLDALMTYGAALQGRAPDTPPADPERYAAAGSIPASSAGADNAALKQRVYTALGRLLYRLERHHDLKPDLVAQFDLLGRDL